MKGGIDPPCSPRANAFHPSVTILSRREAALPSGSVALRELPLRQPWRRVRFPKNPDAVCVISRHKYKVYPFVGPDRHRLARKLVVLDTGAGPNFIRATELPAEVCRNVTARPLPDIRDANGRPIRMSGTLRLSVQ